MRTSFVSISLIFVFVTPQAVNTPDHITNAFASVVIPSTIRTRGILGPALLIFMLVVLALIASVMIPERVDGAAHKANAQFVTQP